MAGIFQADIFCDDCIDSIQWRIATEIWAEGPDAILPDGTILREHTDLEDCDDLHEYLRWMDERSYDSDAYPKHCSDDEECDCPQHCGSHEDCINAEVLSDGYKCGHFFGNSLTTDGIRYVEDAVSDDLLAGRTDSPACELWLPCYEYEIDWDRMGIAACEHCEQWFEIADLDDDDLCPACAEKASYND